MENKREKKNNQVNNLDNININKSNNPLNDYDVIINKTIKFFEQNKNNLDKFIKIIEDSIKRNKSILIKHHNDADGFASALLIELIIKTIASDLDIYVKYRRNVSRTPYYSFSDALSDISFLNKNSLIIILDLGSNSQSKLSYELFKANNIDLVLIDHHPFDIDLNFFKVAINPYLNGFDSNITTTLICGELTKLVSYSKVIDDLSLIGIISDKSKFKDLINDKTLNKKAKILDFLANQSKNSNVSNILLKILFNRDQIDLIYNFVEKLFKKSIQNTYYYHKQIKDINITFVFLNSNFDYPNSGKLTGLIHDLFKTKRKQLTLGITKNNLIIRSNLKKDEFDINYFIDLFELEGGGHFNAGTIKTDDMNITISKIIEYLRKI